MLLCSCKRQTVGLAPGDVPPPFSLPYLELSAVKDGTAKRASDLPVKSLSEFSDKTVLLNFWATWCAPCVKELPELQALSEMGASQDFTVIGVAVQDDIVKVSQIMTKYGITYPVFLDSSGEIRDRYKVNGYPESFLIRKGGKLSLFADSATRTPIVRIVGPRLWNEVETLDALGIRIK
jgi:thiol-disulfide isomerase/thioredoxin